MKENTEAAVYVRINVIAFYYCSASQDYVKGVIAEDYPKIKEEGKIFSLASWANLTWIEMDFSTSEVTKEQTSLYLPPLEDPLHNIVVRLAV